MWRSPSAEDQERLEKFIQMLARGGTLHLPPRLFAQLQALPGGAAGTLPPGVKVAESRLLGPDEMVVTAPPETTRMEFLAPDPSAAGDTLWPRLYGGALYPEGSPERAEFDARQREEAEKQLDAMLRTSISRLGGL
jgi:hypothetical protein